MLPIYLDIIDEAKQKVNHNIWCMFELLEATCEGLSYEEILDGIFPQHILQKSLDKCVSIVKELHNMTKDNYKRECLAPIYEWTLYCTILWWIDVADDIELDEIPRNICISKDGIDLYDSLNNVECYLDFLFQDWDFLYVDEIYEIYKRNPNILAKYLHIDIEKYVELMPRDIQEEYRMLEERKNKKMENRNGITFNITGGQVNFSKDSANLNATQNNGISGNELDVIIKAIKDNLSELKKEEADEIIDVVDMAKDELTKPEPKTSRLRNCITLIAPMMTIANGIPVLANNLQKLYEFIMQYIK